MSTNPKKKKTKTDGKPPRKVQVWTVTEKLEVIAMRDEGASCVKIAQEKGMNESTVRSIYAKGEDVQAKGVSGFYHFFFSIL